MPGGVKCGPGIDTLRVYVGRRLAVAIGHRRLGLSVSLPRAPRVPLRQRLRRLGQRGGTEGASAATEREQDDKQQPVCRP